MGVYSSRDTGMLDSAFVPKQQCEPKMQAQTHQYRQPQYQQQVLKSQEIKPLSIITFVQGRY